MNHTAEGESPDHVPPNITAPRDCPNLAEHTIAGFVTVGILEQHSRMPKIGLFLFFMAAVSTIALSGMYSYRLTLLRLQKRIHNVRRNLLHWLVLPFATVIVCTSTAFHWTASLRFSLSRTQLEAQVAQAILGKQPQNFPRWIGFYWIESVEDESFNYQTGKGTIGFVTGRALIDNCGLEYHQANPDSESFLTTRIASNWYLTEW